MREFIFYVGAWLLAWLLIVLMLAVILGGCSITTFGHLTCKGECDLTVERSGGIKQELPTPKLQLTRELQPRKQQD